MKAIFRLAVTASVIGMFAVPVATARAAADPSSTEPRQVAAPFIGTTTSSSSAYFSTLTITPDAGTHTSTKASRFGTVTYGHSFTSTNNAFNASDSNGYFSAQVTFTGTWPMGWTFTLNQTNQYVHFANSLVTEDANQYQSPSGKFTGYHDHHVEPVDYFYHSSVPVNIQGTGLELSIGFTWKFRLPNLSGTANLLVIFNYTATGPIHCAGTAGTSVGPFC